MRLERAHIKSEYRFRLQVDVYLCRDCNMASLKTLKKELRQRMRQTLSQISDESASCQSLASPSHRAQRTADVNGQAQMQSRHCWHCQNINKREG